MAGISDVEAEVEAPGAAQEQPAEHTDGDRWHHNNSNSRGNRRQGGGRGNRRYHRNRPEIFVPDTPETRKYLVDMCVQQIEGMYDINYLCGDTYFRSFMDVEGFMPLIYLFNYPNIGGVGADYNGVLEALKDHATLEVDAENETIRLRAGWDAWLMPNAEGKGVPKYIKEPTEVDQGSYVDGEMDAAPGNMRSRTDSKELSASAPAFVAK